MTDEQRVLTGIDGDTEAIIAELEALVTALKNRDAYIQEVEHTDHMAVEETATETTSVTYALTTEFDGISPAQYDDGRPRGGADE